jgi:hypothetical protein
MDIAVLVFLAIITIFPWAIQWKSTFKAAKEKGRRGFLVIGFLAWLLFVGYVMLRRIR